MKPLALLAALALLAPGCRSMGAVDAADIAVNVAIATSVAVARRAEGDCYVPCDFGTYCDTRTGTCEALPCHG